MHSAANYRELAHDAREGRDSISTPILRRALDDLVVAYERQADAIDEWRASDALAGSDLQEQGGSILVAGRQRPRGWGSFVVPAKWERDDSDSDRRSRASEELAKRLLGK